MHDYMCTCFSNAPNCQERHTRGNQQRVLQVWPLTCLFACFFGCTLASRELAVSVSLSSESADGLLVVFFPSILLFSKHFCIVGQLDKVDRQLARPLQGWHWS